MSNRSGTAAPIGRKPVNITTDNQALADACDVIILCVPPAALHTIKIDAPDKLILSVMAGASLATISEITGSLRVVRAMTGPVPGFVAYFAQCMVDYATDAGISPDVADRAIRQLFLAGGTILAKDGPTPAEHVAGMIDYAGTTAAGLASMQTSPIARSISDGLDAAVAKARSMG